MIVSKPSTAQDTNSPKKKANRWFRQTSKQAAQLTELNHLFDLYWGGPERRITGLTLKIISVNVIALITLLIGVLYLGQYQNNIIEAKLENFEREALIIAHATANLDLDTAQGQSQIKKLIANSPQSIQIYDNSKTLILKQKSQYQNRPRKADPSSVAVLKSTAKFVTSWMPDKKTIPPYPYHASFPPDLNEAISGLISMSAWEDIEEEVILSAGIPVIKNDGVSGAIVLIREGDDIKAAISEVWRSVLKIFGVTLLITLILSIYLAGTIAKPLKKLANVAEAVRTGKATGEDIPDFSGRYDEIGDLSIVLRSMTDALWEKMDSIESFAADVAHELKNPLTSLSSALETMEKVKKKADREKLLGIIKHDIRRMDRLITDISSASRLDAALSREEFTTVNMNELLTSLLDSYKDPILREGMSDTDIKTKDNIRIHFNPKPNQDYHIKGSKQRLEQVFQNIIDNALSFSNDNDTIEITLNRGENLLAIHIDDEGIGVPDNKLQTIFDRFYTERPSEAYGQNSGLGLSICKQIIDSHRGEIFAENRRNEDGDIIGARFTVILKTIR